MNLIVSYDHYDWSVIYLSALLWSNHHAHWAQSIADGAEINDNNKTQASAFTLPGQVETGYRSTWDLKKAAIQSKRFSKELDGFTRRSWDSLALHNRKVRLYFIVKHLRKAVLSNECLAVTT